MIRVLHVLGGLDRGGAETMVMNLYRNIDRKRIQFDFVIHTDAKQAYYDEILSLGGKIYSFPKFSGLNFSALKNKWNCFFQEHPEYIILHSHVRSYASVYLPIAKKYGVKTIIHSHSTSNGKGISAVAKAILQFPLRYQADYFAGCSKEAGQWLFGKKVVESERFKIVKNSIDAKKFIFNPDVRSQVRSSLQLTDEMVFVHIGRFHPAKNHDFLIRLFLRIHQKKPNTKLILIGDGDLYEAVEHQIHELGLENAVLMLGSKGNVADYLQAADCFLFPSLWEGLGMSAVEAQASGLKCICSTEVPTSVQVCSLCNFLPLNDMDKWLNCALECNYERINTFDKVVTAGYDIHSSVSWLTKFYEEINQK